jgi:hypothetical protein
MSYGPQLPPHLANNKIASQEDDATEDGDDAYRPALPPHLVKKKPQQPATGRSPSPVLIPKTATSEPSIPPVQEDPDSDNDFGPPPPTAGPSTMGNGDAVREFKEREQRRKELAEVSYLSKCILHTPPQSFSRKCPPSCRPILRNYYPP